MGFRNTLFSLQMLAALAKVRTFVIVILATIWGVHPQDLFSQSQPYSTSQDSLGTFAELGRQVIRPTRISYKRRASPQGTSATHPVSGERDSPATES
jgi:hypothetical protein